MPRAFLRLILFALLLSWAEAGENSAATPEPRSDEGWKQKHETMVAKATTFPEVIFLGDSITELWDHPEYGGPVWKERYAPLKAATLGISADRVEQILWRLQNGEFPDGFRPAVVVLLAGTNNVYTNSPVQIAEGLHAVTTEILQRSPHTKILLLGVLPRGEKRDHGDRAKVAAMNREIANLGDGKTVIYADLGSIFLQPDGTISRDVMVDFIHPSTLGYRKWADAMQPILSPLLPEK